MVQLARSVARKFKARANPRTRVIIKVTTRGGYPGRPEKTAPTTGGRSRNHSNCWNFSTCYRIFRVFSRGVHVCARRCTSSIRLSTFLPLRTTWLARWLKLPGKRRDYVLRDRGRSLVHGGASRNAYAAHL